MIPKPSKNNILSITMLVCILSFSFSVNAAGSGITYSGRLIDPNGSPVIGNSVQFRLQIRTPGNENCLFYEEIQTKDMTNSDGVFSITINDGTGSRTDSTGFTLDQIFANRGSFNFPASYCVVGSNYSPNSSDGRKLQVYFNDGSFATGQWEPTPAIAINFIPMAIEAQQVGGYQKEQILKLADGVNTTGSELDSAKWTSLLALINGTSSVYMKPSDQVTQLYGASLPIPVNGQSIRWNTALNAGSGGWENFTAGSASSVTTVSSANSDIDVASGSTTPILTLNSGTSANQIVKLNGAAQLPALDGANLTNLNASKLAGTTIDIAALASGEVLKYNGANWINSADADTLGGLSCANGRVAYHASGNWSCLEVTSGSTINTLVSRDASGLSNFGTVNANTLKLNDGVSGEISLTTPMTVSSYSMKLPTSVGSAGQVLTTDGNTPAQLSWVNTSSQWITSGNNIYYNTGSIGIGTTSPDSQLQTNTSSISTIGQIIKWGQAGQTANLLEFQNDTGNILSRIDKDGKFYGDGSGLTNISAIATPAGSTGQIQFNSGASSLAADSNLNWDNTNKRLGIGMTPAANNPLAVAGTGGSIYPAIAIFNTTGDSSMRFTTDAQTYTIGVDNGSEDNFKISKSSSLGSNDLLAILPSGSVGIGTTSPQAILDIVSTGTSSAIIVPRATTVNRPTPLDGMIRYNTTTALFEFYQSGSWINYTTVSDGRLKTNITPIRQGLEIVSQLNPVFFDWDQNNPRAQSFGNQHQVGFIAQEVEKILPEVVSKGKDSYRSVEYGKIVSVVVAAIKELYSKLTNSERNIASLKTLVDFEKTVKDKEIAELKERVKTVEKENKEIKAFICSKSRELSFCK